MGDLSGDRERYLVEPGDSSLKVRNDVDRNPSRLQDAHLLVVVISALLGRDRR
jgi:hypothetical protein